MKKLVRKFLKFLRKSKKILKITTKNFRKNFKEIRFKSLSSAESKILNN